MRHSHGPAPASARTESRRVHPQHACKTVRATARGIRRCAWPWSLALLLATPATGQQAFVLSTDFESAYYSILSLVPPYPTQPQVAPTCADAVVRSHGDRIYVLGRFGCDHVQVIDGTSGATLTQWSTGVGSNPQDIEIFTPTKAYVSLYDRDFLLVVNPQNGASLGQISLATFSDDDGLPEAHEMVLVGDRLFVTLQRLDRPGGFVAAHPSYVAVVDCTTDQLVDVDPLTGGVQGIALTGRNPFGELLLDPVRQKIVVSETGNFGVLDGGGEFIDPESLMAEGFFITESTLGGDLNTLRLWSDCTGYAIITDSSFNTQLQRFDFCTQTALGSCLTSSSFDLADLELRIEGALLVADRDLQSPGVRIFQAPGCTELTPSPIDFGLPPQDIALVQSQEPTSAPPSIAATALRLLPNRPNPFNPATLLRFDAPLGEPVVLDLFDLRGRRLQRLWEGEAPSGTVQLRWQGQDDRGRTLPSGTYIVRLQSARESTSRRLTLLR